MFSLTPFLHGFGTGAGLIIAIGAQNAHVLRVGLLGRHVALTVATCIAVDVIAITAGVAGMGALIQGQPWLLAIARWGGAAFLAWYGFGALRRALRPDGALAAGAGGPDTGPTVRQAFAAVLAVSLLNPHMYLDTVVLLGAIGGQQPAGQQVSFTVGATTASTLWFLTLGLGARRLAPWFAKPVAWRCLDAGIAVVMFSIALFLAFTPLQMTP